MGQVPLRRIIDEEAGPACQHGDKVAGQLFRDGGAAIARSHYAVFFEDTVADIGCAMDHDIPPVRQGIEAPIEAVEAKGKAIFAYIGVAGDIESQAAFMRFRCVGKAAGELFTGADAMRHVVAAHQLFRIEVDDIHAFLAGRLAEIADGEDVGVLDLVSFQQAMVAYQRVLQYFFVQAFAGELQVFVQYVGFHSYHPKFGLTCGGGAPGGGKADGFCL